MKGDTTTCSMEKISRNTAFFILFVMQLCQCDAIAEIKLARFDRMANYDGLSCFQSDVTFLQTDVLTKINCLSSCSMKSDCECVFYKKDYCQGCRGCCHHGATLPALAGTTYYFLKKPAITYGPYYYLIVSCPATWENALNYCSSLNATLLYIETQAELDFIAGQLGPYDYWSGGQLLDRYVWTHSGVQVNMSLFTDDEPNGTGPCARLKRSSSFKLADYYCTTPFPFICKSF